MGTNKEILESLRERREIEAVFEMANITKNKSGLPFDVWVDSVGKDRNIGHSSQRIKIKKSGMEIEISFYDDPKIEAGEQNLKAFGVSDVNTVIKYVSKHKTLFLAHWNKEIDDTDIGIAMQLIKKNPNISDEEAIKRAKALVD